MLSYRVASYGNESWLSQTNHATLCVTSNVLQTKVDAQCDKLATVEVVVVVVVVDGGGSGSGN